MSKLEELIQELCPDGVEFKTADEIFNIRGGYTPSKKKPEFWANGTVPWFRMEDIRENGRILSDSIQHINISAVKGEPFEANSIIVATSATIGEHALITVPSVSNQRFTCLTLRPEYKPLFDIKFIFYYCFNLDAWCKNNVNEGNFASVDMKRLAKFKFPVPPLEVQREIIRILDNFSEATQKLEEELKAELVARQKQYEYYRDKLLTFDVHGGGTSDVVWRTLGEVCSLKAGKAIPSYEISPEPTAEYCIPCYGGNGLRGYVRQANQQGEKSLIGRQGALCGNVCYAAGDYYATEHAVVVTDKGNFNNRFLYHLLVHENLNQYKTAGAQPGLSVSRLEKVTVPVPDIAIQNKIAYVLDNFDAICTDLNIGLPAEIEARQKQYEFYRDKLLTFAATGGTISQHNTTQHNTTQHNTTQHNTTQHKVIVAP